MTKRRRRRADPTDHWEQLELLCAWDEQREYERIRPLILFGEPIPERAVQTGTSERTLYRRIAGFEEHGMRSLFGSDPAKRRVLPASLRRLIVDLKAEHPMLNFNEISRICYVRTGRKPHLATVRGVLDEEPVPIKAFRRFAPYHEIPEGRERRKAVVALHCEGWADKSIARYLKIDHSTVRGVLKRWEQEGPEGLEDRKCGRPKGVQKVDLRAMAEVRRRQENPELGAYRMRAALEQVGRILAANREAEGLPKPRRSPHTKREMPFEASHRHEIWTSDVRYVDYSIPGTGQAYVVSILDNFSRAILASAITLSQDTNAYLSVLHAAIERHGSPGTIVTDGGGIFRSDRAKAVYRALGIEKVEIERGRPWQSFIETTFNIQRRMADFHFGRVTTWEGVGRRARPLAGELQRPEAHEGRQGGRRSPSDVLGSLTLVRHHPKDLERAFFSTMFVRRLDVVGYARLKHWRIYGEEGLARCEVAVWLGDDGLVVEYGGESLSHYDVSFSSGAQRLDAVTNVWLYATRHRSPQLKLFALEEALGDTGWLKALALDGYAPRSRSKPEMLQGALFSYLEAP